MCRNIKRLAKLEPRATEADIRDAAQQYVRKISGITKPSKTNGKAFEDAVNEITAASSHLLAALEKNAHTRSVTNPSVDLSGETTP